MRFFKYLFAFLVIFMPMKSVMGVEFSHSEASAISANEGHVVLKWADGEPPFKLIVEKSDGSSLELYEGQDLGFFMTGLGEGEHTFTVQDSTGSTDTVSVAVDFPSMSLMWFSIVSGAILFSILCFIILRGSRDARSLA